MGGWLTILIALRAPLGALAAVVILGAAILPPEARAAAHALFCVPGITIDGGDGDRPDGFDKRLCAFCTMPTALPADVEARPLARRTVDLAPPDVSTNWRAAPALVRNKGPPTVVGS